MKAWTRWQDWVAVVAGVYAILSPIWVSTTHEGGAVASLIVLGALLVITGLYSLARATTLSSVAAQWLLVLWGVLLFVAPWVITYTSHSGAAWTSWIVGVIGVLAGLSVSLTGDLAHRRAIPH
ncbi:SPW repeat protein [Actinomadura sp. DC4]|uniref:SPW repeat domain-containing protein n=1 Tax=Actinomadura sp. DC4 TaxID=3055069 RepID=UPI0025AF60A8|nr:SPW repeat protein [Actinomadura sp. DC4]MDN3358730.1 SPW repeat protein [Actinomadura sp. DC4]